MDSNNILIKIGADITDFSRKMKQSTSELDKFQDANKKTFDSFKQVGGAITGAGVAIAAGLGFAVKKAATFDTSMRKAGAIAGATGKEFDAMKSAAIQLGADTSKSASEVAEAMTEMAAKGFNATQIIAAMPGVISASEASGEALALTADTVATALNVWGLEAGEASRVADVLAMSANVSAAGIDDLGYVMKYAGAPAAALGISLEEVAAAAGIMTDAGLDGSNAGTSLRASLLALNNPAKAQQKIMERLGFSMRDGEGNAKSLTEMIRDMKSATEGMTEAEKVATLGKLVGTEAVSGFLALMKAGPDEISKNTKALENSAGASKEAADAMMAGIGGALEELSGALESAAILIGDVLVPYVQDFAKYIGELVDKFNNASPALQDFIVKGAALAGAAMLIIGPLLLLIGFLPAIISGFTAVGTVIGAVTTFFAPAAAAAATAAGATSGLGVAMAVLTGPVGIAIAAIAGIIAILVLAYNKVGWFRDGVNAIWARIKEMTAIAFGFIKDIISKVLTEVVNFGKSMLDKFRVFWDENGKAIMSLVKTNFNNIKATIEMVMGIIKGIFQIVWPIISGIVKVAWGVIKTAVSNGIDLVLGIIQTVMKLIQGDWKGAWDTIKQTVDKMLKNIVKSFKDVDLQQIGKDMLKGLIKGIGSMVEAVKTKISSLAESMPDWMRKILGIHSPSRVMAEIGKYIGQGLGVGISDSKRVVIGAMTGLLNVLKAVTKAESAEVVAINRKQAAEEKDIATKKARDIANIHAVAKANKRKLTLSEAQRIAKIESDSSAKLVATQRKYNADKAKAQADSAKEYLDAVKTYVADKNALEQLSLVAESEIWRKSVGLFKAGTKERIEAQKAYQTALKAVNDEITKTNEEYAGKMTAINDKLRKDEEELTALYTKSLDDRMKSLMSFAGLFDDFDVKVEKSGADLLANLNAQVDGFKLWQTEIEKISGKAIDDGLIAELREMGPKALPQLLALNSMTDEQMSQYSALYQEKAALARTQAEAELVGMKADTAARITELRAVANVELEALRAEWVTKIKSVTKATNDELLTLKSIGKNAGKGLMDGLASMEPALVAKAKSIAEAVKAAMAGAFDIHSPSRWMRDFIGVNMMRGWIDGMSSMRSNVLAMSASASGWMTPDVPQIAGYQTPTSGAGVGRAVLTASDTGGGGKSGGFTQNLTINSPQQLSPFEIARLNKQESQRFAMEVGLR